MDQLTRRRKEVRALRAELVKGLEEIRGRLSPAQLVDDAISMLDPGQRFLGQLRAGIKRNPLLAATLVAGASWLVTDAMRHESSISKRPPARARKPTTNKGGFHDTQHHDGDERPNAFDGQNQARPQP